MLNHCDLNSGGVRWLAALLVLMLAIGLLTLGRTPLAVGLLATPWDKLAHLTVFALVAALLLVSFGSHRIAGAVLALLVTGAIAAADEVQQLFLPGRSADWEDLLADLAGAIIGLLLSRMFIGRPRSGRAQASV